MKVEVLAIASLIMFSSVFFVCQESRADTIYSVTHTPTEPNPLHNVTIVAPGQDFVLNVSVNWLANGVAGWSVMHFASASDNWYGTIPAQAVDTKVYYCVTVESLSGPGERHPESGYYMYTVVPGDMPDLTIDRETTTFNPDPGEEKVYDTDKVSMRISVNNLGWVDAQDVSVSVLDNGETVHTETLTTLMKRGHLIVNYAWFPEPGEHNITIVADPTETITEFNETNNAQTYSFTIHSLTMVPSGNLTDTVTLGFGEYNAWRFDASDNYVRIAIDTNGGEVDFYVLTESQFSLYSNPLASSFGYEVARESRDSFDWFEKPGETYYVVIDNAAISASGAQPSGDITYDVAVSFEEHDEFIIYQVLALVLIIGSVIGVMYLVQRRKKSEPPVQEHMPVVFDGEEKPPK